MAQRTALGKGLGALLGGGNTDMTSAVPAAPVTRTAADDPSSVKEIPLSGIIPNPYQPRVTFDAEAISELADSIRNLGIIQPLTLRLMPDGKYQIISGERRYRASLEAGLKSVPAYIRKADDAAMLEMAIVENIQRENLDAIETAIGFQRLIDECNLTQEAMALRVGKKRTTITNFLRLLKLPPEVQKAVKENAISAGHARALLAIEDSFAQIELCDKAIKGGWSVRTMEEKVKKYLEGPVQRSRSAAPDNFSSVVDLFSRFGGKAAVKAKGNASSITIKFSRTEDLNRFIEAADIFKNIR